jgi:hypothetical protein
MAPINMRYSVATLIIISTATPVSAWDIHPVKDPVSNEAVPSASVATTGASLVVACTNGQPQPRLRLDQAIETSNVAISYRFDDGVLAQRVASVSPQGLDLWPWTADYSAAAWRLRRAKRFRLILNQTTFDFDLSTGDQLPLFLC